MQEVQQLQEAQQKLLAQLQLKEDQLLRLTAQEQHHRDKMDTLSRIYCEKTKKLMASLELAKKESLRLKDLSRENRRSELIQQLQKESGDQDHIIGVLRQLINDDNKADAAIIRSLQKGPPRVRVLTREELKMENKALQTQVKSLQAKAKVNREGKEEEGHPQEEEAEQSSPPPDTQEQQHRTSLGQDFLKQHQELKQEMEALKVGNTSSQNLIYQLKEQLKWKNQEIEKLVETQKDIEVINSKYQELKQLHDQRLKESLKEAQHQKDDELNLEKQLILVKNLQGQLQEEKLNVQLLNMKINDLSYDQQKNIKKKNIMVHNSEQLVQKLDICLKENIALKDQVNQLSLDLLEEKKARKLLDKENEKQQMAFKSQRTMQEIEQHKRYEALQKQLDQQTAESKEVLSRKVEEMAPLLKDNTRLKEELKNTRKKEMMLMDQNEALEMELMASKQGNLMQMQAKRELRNMGSMKRQRMALEQEGRQLDALSQLDSDLSMIQSQEGSVFVSNSSVSELRRPLDNSNESLLEGSLASDSAVSQALLLSVNQHLQKDLDLSRQRGRKLEEINERLIAQYSKAHRKAEHSSQHYLKLLEEHAEHVARLQVHTQTGKTFLLIKETGNLYDQLSDISQPLSSKEEAQLQQRHNNYLVTSDISSLQSQRLSQVSSNL